MLVTTTSAKVVCSFILSSICCHCHKSKNPQSYAAKVGLLKGFDSLRANPKKSAAYKDFRIDLRQKYKYFLDYKIINC